MGKLAKVAADHRPEYAYYRPGHNYLSPNHRLQLEMIDARNLNPWASSWSWICGGFVGSSNSDVLRQDRFSRRPLRKQTNNKLLPSRRYLQNLSLLHRRRAPRCRFGLRRDTGDLDAMVKRRQIRALVILNPIGFFYDKGQPKGAIYETLEGISEVRQPEAEDRQVPVTVLLSPCEPTS